MHATDGDSGINGQIKYKLDEKARRWLDVNSSSGEVYTIRSVQLSESGSCLFVPFSALLGRFFEILKKVCLNLSL